MLSKIQVVNDFMFTGQGKLIIREPVKNPITKVTELKEISQEEFKCRISFEKGNSEEDYGAVKAYRYMILFTPNNFIIPEGSKIIVNQNNQEFILSNSGIPAVYPTHREYPVVEWVKWQ